MDDLRIVTGRDLGFLLCKLFSLDPKNVVNLTVTCRANGLAKVTVDMYVRAPDGKVTVEAGVVTKRFTLKDDDGLL